MQKVANAVLKNLSTILKSGS